MRPFEFSIFKPHKKNIVCKVFTRDGGRKTKEKNKKPFDSLNISFSVGDDNLNVKKNRELVLKNTGFKSLFFINQVHKDAVFILKKNGDINKQITADAVITNLKNVGLAIQTADCQAILLYDKKKGVVSAIHSGWKSSIVNIIGKTVLKMKENFGSSAGDIIVGISPSLGKCCAEFKNYKSEIPKKFWKYKDFQNHFDFWKISQEQLIESGIKKENIEISGICTKCNFKTFFSYRKNKITGRFVSVVGKK